ncbi:hypothetical protein MKW94_016510 [Papaver nudicaule]|uniref:Ribosomal protein S12 n=1 Tax=Papaver nudicaule TaxID=74823 RepID=A0AA41S9J0_PAPNU|nr:hypothetical protein [Papaver nudicaule]
MLGCVQHSSLCCGVDPVRYSQKQLHSNGNSSLLGMRRPLQNSGNAFHWMCHPLLTQGNHHRRCVQKYMFKREKTSFLGYPFSCLSGVKKDGCIAQQSDAYMIDTVSLAIGHCQEAHTESNLKVPAITGALEKMELTPKVMDLTSQEGLVYISGPTYASSTVAASSISYKPPLTGFGHHSISEGRMGFGAFENVAARRVQHISFATVRQLIHHGRAKKWQPQNRGLSNCPQKQGVCLKVGIRLPKKPNSGKRKIARVRLSNGQDVTCLIPGEGHNLMEHSIVLVRGGRVKDLPGVKYHCIRGTRDLKGIPERRRGRSKYGTRTGKPELEKPK